MIVAFASVLQSVCNFFFCILHGATLKSQKVKNKYIH